MKFQYAPLLISFLFLSCQKEETVPDPSTWGRPITIHSSATVVPLNEFGVAVLTSRTNVGDDVTNQTSFYVNDALLNNNVFIPPATGSYTIYGVYRNFKSQLIQIRVETPLHKKILVELFTSRTCGFCPWIGNRLDSLQAANKSVISYSIHGQDELESNETPALQEYLQVYERPSVRVQRGYVRNYAPPIEISELIDSVRYFLSVQPELEIAMQSHLSGRQLVVNVFGKFSREIRDDFYLSLMVVEDSVVTHDQYNYFSGYPPSANPFCNQPFLLPDYNNHNVLRKCLTDPRGDLIDPGVYEFNSPREIGEASVELDPQIMLNNAYIIAIVHRRRDDIEVSSVMNTQIVRAGENVDFED